MPDLDMVIANAPTRVFALMHDARPVLINFGERGAFDRIAVPWRDHVRMIDAQYRGAWELPVIGVVDAPGAVLIRPDGHVAWVSEGRDSGLAEALTFWFGAPAGP